VGGLEGGFEAVGEEGFGAGGADGGEEEFAEGGDCGGALVGLFGEIEEVIDLDAGGEDGALEFAGEELLEGLGQGRGVFGKSPLIDGDAGCLAALGSEAGEEFGIWAAVFLDGH